MPLEFPKFEVETLPSNATILAAKVDGSDIVAVQGSLNAGAAFEPKGEEGVAEATARLLTRGTKRRNQRELSETLESQGIIFNVGNDIETVNFHGKCRAENLKTLLRLVAEILFEPSFPSGEVEKVKGDILTDIRIEQDDTRITAEKRLLRLVFPRGHPYGSDPLGSPETVQGLAKEAISEYHREHYAPKTMILSAAGPYTLREILARLPSRLSKTEKQKETSTIPKPESRPAATRQIVSMPHKSQIDVAYGCATIPRSHPDYYALRMVNLVLGGQGFSLSNRLMKNLRDRDGLAYYAYSDFVPMTSSGYWYVYAGVNPANLTKALKGIRTEISTLLEKGVEADELSRGKSNQIGRLAMAMETLSGVAEILREIRYFNLGMDYLSRYPGIVNSLDTEDVLRVAGRYLDMERMSLVLAGPVDAKSVSMPI